MTLEVQSVEKTGVTSHIDVLIHNQRGRTDMTIAGKGPQDLLAVKIDTADGIIVNVNAEVIHERRRRISIKAKTEICPSVGVQGDAVSGETLRITDIHPPEVNHRCVAASSFARSGVVPQLLPTSY